jgi:hypothetical protein
VQAAGASGALQDGHEPPLARRGGVVPALLAVVAIAVLGCAACTSGSSGQPSATRSAPALTAKRADALSSDLAAGNEAPLRDALAVPSGQALDPAAAAQIAALAPITLDQKSFSQLDARTGTVTGTVAHPPAGQPSTWTFQLAYIAGKWRVVDGTPAS